MNNLAASSSVPAVYPEYVRTEWKLLALKRIDNPQVPITDIAKALGYNANTVRVWLQSSAYQRYENWLIDLRRHELIDVPVQPSARFRTNTVPERFDEYASEMQERLLDLIETCTSEKLQASLIKDWLAYGGTVPKGLPTASNGSGPILTADKMVILIQRAAEVGMTVESLQRYLPREVAVDGNPL